MCPAGAPNAGTGAPTRCRSTARRRRTARDEVERELIAHVFSRSRSGDTPVEVLGETKGKLGADAYSGYNKVTLPGGRERAGCLAHLRRRFFDAQPAAPDAARKAVGFILDVYRVERAVLDADLLGTPVHLEPVSYLADVLLRVQTHPAARIDELLPHNWQPPEAQPST